MHAGKEATVIHLGYPEDNDTHDALATSVTAKEEDGGTQLGRDNHFGHNADNVDAAGTRRKPIYNSKVTDFSVKAVPNIALSAKDEKMRDKQSSFMMPGETAENIQLPQRIEMANDQPSHDDDDLRGVESHNSRIPPQPTKTLSPSETIARGKQLDPERDTPAETLLSLSIQVLAITVRLSF